MDLTPEYDNSCMTCSHWLVASTKPESLFVCEMLGCHTRPTHECNMWSKDPGSSVETSKIRIDKHTESVHETYKRSIERNGIKADWRFETKYILCEAIPPSKKDEAEPGLSDGEIEVGIGIGRESQDANKVTV